MAAARAQGGQQGRLAPALVLSGLQGGEQHDEPRQQGEAEHELHRPDDLLHNAPDLPEDGVHINDGDAGIGPDEIQQQAFVRRRQMEAGDVSGGVVIQRAGVDHDEEIDIESVPVNPPEIGDDPAHPLLRDGEGQAVAPGDVQGLRKLVFKGKQNVIRGAPPLAFHQAVVFLQGFRHRQVEDPPGEHARLFVFVVVGIDRLAVNGCQAGSHHGVRLGRQPGPGLHELLDLIDFAGLDVNEEIIGRALRQTVAPMLQQVGPHQGQQGQRHGAQARRQDLRRAQWGPADDVGQTKTDGAARLVPQPVKPANNQAGRQKRQQAGQQQAQQAVQGQFEIARLPQGQQEQAPDGGGIDDQIAGGQGG